MPIVIVSLPEARLYLRRKFIYRITREAISDDGSATATAIGTATQHQP